jgi:hypothetical protein
MLGRVRNAVVVAVCAAIFVAPSRAEAGDGKKLLPLLADTAEIVAVFDVADARDAAAFGTLLDSAPAKLAELLYALTAAGIDPREDVDTLVLGGHDEVYQIVLEGRFGKDQLAGIIGSGTAKKHRGVRYWTSSDGEVAVLGKRLVLSTPGEMTGVIDRHKKKGRSLARSPDAAAIRGAIGLVDPRHDVWLAVAGGPLPAGGGVEAMALGMTFSGDLQVEVHGRFSDATRVDELRATFDKMMPQVAQSLDQMGLDGVAASLAVEWNGEVVDAAATVPADELATVLQLLAMM